MLSSMACSPLLLSGSLVLVVFFAIAWQLFLYTTPSRNTLRVQYMQWIENETNPQYMTEWLAHQSVPLVLTETPFDKWNSVNWTLKSLEQNTQIVQVLSKKGTENIFKYFATDQPLSDTNFMSPKEKKSFIEVIYASERFFQILQQPFDGYFYYSSGGIDLLNMNHDVFERDALLSLTFPSHQDKYGHTNYWFGSQNVTAYTHYDTSYNLHMVIRGKKKFILFPPRVYDSLQLYPCLHTFYRQVYTDIFQDSSTIERLGGVEVILNPGEVLFLPPYWFHSVVTMETTLSLNVWSHSEVFLSMEEIFNEGIPFEEHWGRETLMKALNYFVDRLTETVLGQGSNYSVFVRERVYSRYKPLIEQASQDDFDLHLVNLTVSRYCLDTPIESLVKESELRHIDAGVKRLAGCFARIPAGPVLEINLANYIEHLALRILGGDDIIYLPFYLQMCF